MGSSELYLWPFSDPWVPGLCLPSRCLGTVPHGHFRLRLVLAALEAPIWGGGCEPGALSRVPCGQAELGTMPVRPSVGISSSSPLEMSPFRGSSLPPLFEGVGPPVRSVCQTCSDVPRGPSSRVSWPFWSPSCQSRPRMASFFFCPPLGVAST